MNVKKIKLECIVILLFAWDLLSRKARKKVPSIDNDDDDNNNNNDEDEDDNDKYNDYNNDTQQ